MKILLSPHSDDAVLFASYLIQREKLLVITVTHATLQDNNGYQRVLEDYDAMNILGAPICYLGIDEDKLTEELLREKLKVFSCETMYVPEYEENGNPQHNLVNKVAKEMFSNVKEYKTYSGLEDRTIGKEVIPTEEELELKKRAMRCYRTQMSNPNTAHYFLNHREYE